MRPAPLTIKKERRSAFPPWGSPLVESDPLVKKCEWYQRIAAAITVYMSDPDHTHTREELAYLNLLKPTLQDIFYLSSYGSMDHILWHRGIVDENGQVNLPPRMHWIT